ncbi:hypothetical protein [Mesorhizobium sp. M0146]|uniref:hypothetical protein n=1 Tax=unclassified Mesorhizobium TaxID=325217 RepID=UPI003339F4F7
MPEALKSSPIQDATKGLTAAERKQFRQAIRWFFADPDAVSMQELALVRVYLEAKNRAGLLKKLLALEAQDDGLLEMAAPRIVALVRQSDATAKLVVKLVERLKPRRA